MGTTDRFRPLAVGLVVLALLIGGTAIAAGEPVSQGREEMGCRGDARGLDLSTVPPHRHVDICRSGMLARWVLTSGCTLIIPG